MTKSVPKEACLGVVESASGFRHNLRQILLKHFIAFSNGTEPTPTMYNARIQPR